jgi:hypothetical protein
MSHRYLYSVPSCHGQMRQAVHCGMYWQCGRLIILSSPMSLWNEYSTCPRHSETGSDSLYLQGLDRCHGGDENCDKYCPPVSRIKGNTSRLIMGVLEW